MYSLWELALYLILYSFAGWAVEMCYTAVRSRHFINYGFLNLPFVLPHGIAAVFFADSPERTADSREYGDFGGYRGYFRRLGQCVEYTAVEVG